MKTSKKWLLLLRHFFKVHRLVWEGKKLLSFLKEIFKIHWILWEGKKLLLFLKEVFKMHWILWEGKKLLLFLKETFKVHRLRWKGKKLLLFLKEIFKMHSILQKGKKGLSFLKEILKVYWILSKGGIVFLVLISAAMGYYLQGGRFGEKLFWDVLMSTALVCAGACAFNHVFEADIDKSMKRTQNRPLVTGQISKKHGFIFAFLISIFGLWLMWEKISMLMMIGGLMTMLMYLLMYTPLKQKTKYNTLIGAIPGALPVLGGGAAIAGMGVNASVWILFALLYCWQHPHFHAIAWLCQKDYQTSRFKMLSNQDEKLMFFHMIFFTFCTFVLSMLLFLTEQLSLFYFMIAFILGAYFLYISIEIIQTNRRKENAKKVLWTSIVYIPLLFGVLILDQTYLSL